VRRHFQKAACNGSEQTGPAHCTSFITFGALQSKKEETKLMRKNESSKEFRFEPQKGKKNGI
jgi:hypothetical protein